MNKLLLFVMNHLMILKLGHCEVSKWMSMLIGMEQLSRNRSTIFLRSSQIVDTGSPTMHGWKSMLMWHGIIGLSIGDSHYREYSNPKFTFKFNIRKNKSYGIESLHCHHENFLLEN